MTFVPAILLAVGLAAPQLDPALEQEARKIETMLIAPCCWSQQVSVHQSPAADEMRARIRAMLQEGRSEQEILDTFGAEFGDRIFAVPPARGYKLTLYVLPVVLLVVSAALLAVLVGRMARSAPAATSATSSPDPDNGYRERLADELRDLD